MPMYEVREAYKGIIPARGLKLFGVDFEMSIVVDPYKGIIPARGLKRFKYGENIVLIS